MSSFASGQPPLPGQQYASGSTNHHGYQHPGAAIAPSPQGQAPPHPYTSPVSGDGANRFGQNNASVISTGGGVYAPNPPAAYPGDIAQTQPMHHQQQQQQQQYYEQAQVYRPPQVATNPGYAPTAPNVAGNAQQSNQFNAQYQAPAVPQGQQYHVPQQHSGPASVSYAPPPGPPPSGSPLQNYHSPPSYAPQQALTYGYGAQQVSPHQPMAANPGAQYANNHAHGNAAAAIGASPTYHPPVSQGAQYHVHANPSPVAQQQQQQQQQVHRPYSPLRQQQYQQQQPQQQPQQQLVHRTYSPVQRQYQYSPTHQSMQNQQHQQHQQHQQYSPQPTLAQQPMNPAPASANYAYSQADGGYYRQEPVLLANPPTQPPYHPQPQQQPAQLQVQQHPQAQQAGYHQTPPPMHSQHSSYAGANNYSLGNSAQTLGASPGSRPASLYSAGPQQPQQHQAAYLRQSPSPVPLSQSQMRRENAYRAGNSSSEMVQQMQDGRGGFPEHRMSYASGHTPISSVLASEPVMAPAAGGLLGSGSGSIHRPGGSGLQQGYDASAQPPPLVSQNSSMSTLVCSMGNLSMRPSQAGAGYGFRQQQPPQPPQSQRQSLVMSVPAMGAQAQGSQATLNAGHAPRPSPVSLSQSSYVSPSSSAVPLPVSVVHSAPVVHTSGLQQSALELAGSNTSPSGMAMAYPLWTNITADGFHAYQHHIPVQKSNLTGTKHALIVGINYYNKEYSQTSNINGAHSFRNLLVKRFGYNEKNVVLLSDDQEDPRAHPTHHLITSSIKRMMREVRPNDSVFFYFCGFGRLPMQVLDRRTEAIAGIRRLRSDFILPSDFETAGAIDAAYLKKHLVRQLPQSARLTALFNCVVNETGLGVPYKYANPSGTAVLTNAIAGSNLFEACMGTNAVNASFGDLSQRFESSFMQQASLATGAEADELARIRQSSGDIIVFGWDRDYANPKHKSYLSHTPSNQLGAFWGAAMESALRSRPRATFGDVLAYLQGSCKKIVMMPFIASGRKIRMDEEFDV